MKTYVGTSGWSYPWNPDGFDWYAKNSKLNAVELNSSFYRYPFPAYVKSWAKKGKELRWAVKVNRLITHIYKFSEKAHTRWKSFKKLFEPLDKQIDFYLFQLPPSTTPKSLEKIEKFIKKIKLKQRFAIEVRNEEWFNKEYLKWAKELGITWVSVDAPKFSRDIYKINKFVYVRMHGRKFWYSHNYTDKELKEVVKKIKEKKPKACYVFFNNDHNMLKNARKMKQYLEKI